MNRKPFGDSSMPKPLYEQLADSLYKDIQNNNYPIGTKLPTEKELHLSTGMSRSTVRKALELLVKANLVVKIHGKGTFVSGTKKTDNDIAHFTSLTENLAEMGKAVHSKVVNYQLVTPTEAQCAFFNISQAEQLVEIQRLRYLDDQPFCIDTSWFTTTYKSLLHQDLTGSLYALLRDKYKVTPSAGRKTFAITYASPNAAFLLDVKPNTALMLVEDSVYDEHENPLHLSNQQIRSDRYKYGISQKSLSR
ncbi:GntR family transcriptional regulator [Pediococcus pentosaceus]|uniref:GntR family transcriptional regulator n=1 Tax=Pediococcus pentosaceus TaxID=1255 RepID=UPI002F26B373